MRRSSCGNEGTSPTRSPVAYAQVVLHDVTGDGGLGFCHAALPEMLPPGYHGPLVVALDSNVLIDLQQHGLALMNDEDLPPAVMADRKYAADLEALGRLVDLWLMRDIRLVVTPRSRNDARGALEGDRLVARLSAVDALAESLAFQTQDWYSPPSSAPREPGHPELSGMPALEVDLPEGGDRDLVIEAAKVGAHAFLTRDGRVLRRAKVDGLAALRPSELMARIDETGADHFFGGVCAQDGCPYAGWPPPVSDMGKWGGLLSILGGEE